MSVRIKIAQTAEELNDVFRLRYRVYVEGEGVLKGDPSKKSGTVSDRFDALPPVGNIIAYCDQEPVGTMRINLDAGVGLPPDDIFDSSDYQERVTEEWLRGHDSPPSFGSAGMLAIHPDWRNRRDVIRALLKMGAGMGRMWGGTHVITTPSAKTASMYARMGFEPLSDELWVETIGDHVQPMAASFEDFYNWTFGDLIESRKFLEIFANRFQRVILGSGETLFQEGDAGHEAYIIDTGAIRISRTSGEEAGEYTLATLGRGDMFGELSLIDAKPRSAHATALTNVELIALDRADFHGGLEEQPGLVQDMFEFLAARIRRADEFIAALMADLRGSKIYRMIHALEDIKSSATPDAKRPGVLLAKVGLVEFARDAGVSEQEAREYLEAQKKKQAVEYTDRRIRFLAKALTQ